MSVMAFRLRALLLCSTLVFAAAIAPGCASASSEDEDVSEADLVSTLGLQEVKTATTYKDISTEGGGFGQAGRLAKFLIDNRTPTAPKIYFINSNYKVGGKTPDSAKYHYYFAQKTLGISDSVTEFNEATYNKTAKRFYAGTLQTYTLGEDTDVTYAMQFYPDDVVNEEGVLAAAKILKTAFKIPGAKMAFIAAGPQQTTKRVGPAMQSLGMPAMSIDAVLGSVKYLPLNPGEAWGYLRIFPKSLLDLRPTDIAVFGELPLDLSVVAGTITSAYQDVTSHVNLKSKERGTPNMTLRGAGPAHAQLAPLANKPVHLVVSKSGYVLEPTTAEIVEQKFKQHTSKPWISLPTVSEPKLWVFDNICPTLNAACTQNGNRFGGKAANLGLLANKDVLGRHTQASSLSQRMGYDLTPDGFAIPVQYYRDFMAAPENAALRAKVTELIAKEKLGTWSPNERSAAARAVQELFYKAKVPAAQLAAIESQVAALKVREPAVETIKIRSSANAEDIPNFDGAGLHDSFSADLDATDNADLSCAIQREEAGGVVTKLKISPKSVQCALKGVYASLWNPRAIEERSFARLDHGSASMGIGVVPAYDTESDVVANGVIITRVINGEDILGYTVSSQKDNNLVTNPEPGSIAQTTIASYSDVGRPARLTLTRHATPKQGQPPLTTTVIPDAKMQEILTVAQQVEKAYCHVKNGYYAGDCRYIALDNTKPRALDMEFKLLANGHIVLKQVREFHGQ
jgi:pyruvate,water dikinase